MAKKKEEKEILIRLVDGGMQVDNAGETETVLTEQFKAQQAEQVMKSVVGPLMGKKAVEAVAGFHGCKVDEKHPYLILIAGVPVFSASSKTPDRVKAMIGAGLPPTLFAAFDTRSGEVFVVGGGA
jgi:hypothetical protein